MMTTTSNNNRESNRRKSFLTYKDRFFISFFCGLYMAVASTGKWACIYLFFFHMLSNDLSLHRFHLNFLIQRQFQFSSLSRTLPSRYSPISVLELNLDSLSIQLNMWVSTAMWIDTCTESHDSIIYLINSSKNTCRWNVTRKWGLSEWSLLRRFDVSLFTWNMMLDNWKKDVQLPYTY